MTTDTLIPRSGGLRVALGLLLLLACLALPTAASAGWAPAVDVSTGAIAGGSQFDAITDASGVTTAAWVAGGKLMFARSTGSSWTAPAEVNASAAPYGAPILQLMPNGDVLVLWVECPTGGDHACSISTAEYTVASSTWSAPVLVTANAVGEGFDLSVGPTDVATIGWVGFTPRVVTVATGQPNVSDVWVWTVSPTTYNTGFARSIQIVSDSAGGAMVAWHSDGSAPMDYVRRTSSVWSASAAQISPADAGWGAGWQPTVRLAIDGSDVVTAIWYEIGTNWATPNVQAYVTRVARFRPGTATWSAPVTLTPPGYEGFEGDVASAADGTTTVVWTGNSTLSHARSAVYASTYAPASATWSTPYVLADDGDVSVPRIVGTDHGAMAVWVNVGATWANVLRGGTWQYPITLPGGANPVVTMGGASFTDGWPSGAKVLTTTGVQQLQATTSSATGGTLSAPVDPTALPEYTGLAVSWQAPLESGVWGVQSYTATAAPGGRTCTTTTVSCTITGLENGTAYAVTVTASAAGGSQSAAPVTGTPRVRNGWVGPPIATTIGTGPSWDGTFGTAAIAYSPSASRSLAVTYISDGSGPGYVTTILNGDGTASGITDGRINVDGPDAYWSGSPAVQADPVTGGWLVFYYAGPAGAGNGATCGNSDGSETAGAVRVVPVAADGTIGTVRDAISGICAAGTLSAQWDAANTRFLVAGSITTASGGSKVRGRLIGADGMPIGSMLQLASFATDPQSDLAYSTVSHRYLAVAYGGGVAKAVLLTADGAAVAGVPPLTFADTTGKRPSVAYDSAADQFVVVWGNADVIAQRVSAATGALVGAPMVVASQAWTGRPRAFGNPVTGEVLVAWTGTTASDPNNTISARTIPSGAGPSGTGPVRISGTTRTANRPALTFDGAYCAYRLAFTAQPTSAESVRLYTRGFQPNWCSRAELAVTRTGDGNGSVTAGSGGLDCGAICAATYDRTTEVAPSVVLTATPASGSTFVGWSGGCSGADSTCVVPVGAATAVSARFGIAATPASDASTGSEATSPAAPSAASPLGAPIGSAPGIRVGRAGSRQVGNTLITIVDVAGAGSISQVGLVRQGGRKVRACSARVKVKRAGRVLVRCALKRRVVRAAARSVRLSVAVPIEISTTFTPASGGETSVVRSTAVVRDSPTPMSNVTG